MNLSNLKKWFYNNNCVIKSGDNRQYTHLLLDGGKVHVPTELMDEFYKLYTIDIFNKNKNYICEMRTPIFKYFVDLDMIDKNEISKDEIFEIVKHIQEGLSFFLKDIDNKKQMVIISTTTPKAITHDDKNFIKTGIHLIWPYLKVDMNISLFLREIILQYLLRIYGERPIYNIWSDVVDESVYKQNGLRMIGSHKMHKCKVCKNKAKLRVGCAECFSTGKIDEGRPYNPICIIDGDGNELNDTFEKYDNNKYKLIKKTSIQCFDEDINVKFKEPYPSWFNLSSIDIKGRNRIKKTDNKQIIQVLNEESLLGKNWVKLDPSKEIYTELEKFIKTVYPTHYSDTTILGVYQCGKISEKKVKKDNRYYLVRTDSCYCQNIGREHRSNHIYFHIDKTTISQKCFCTCDTLDGRKDGLCKKYRSDKKNISLKLKSMLYQYQSRRESEKLNLVVNPKLELLKWLDEKIK